MTKTQVNIQLDGEEIGELDAIADKYFTRQAVARMLVLAGLEAIKKNGGKIHLPPKFEVAEPDSIFLREQKPSNYGKKK